MMTERWWEGWWEGVMLLVWLVMMMMQISTCESWVLTDAGGWVARTQLATNPNHLRDALRLH